jgi:hypothetical protein
MERKRIAEASKGMGKPKVGGKFELLDQNGNLWSSEKMKGKFSLVSGKLSCLRMRLTGCAGIFWVFPLSRYLP